jgi:hypothetical protein
VDSAEIEAILEASERALADGGAGRLRDLGYGRAVRAVERNPDWIIRYANRLGAIDRQSFQRRVKLRLPLVSGILALAAGALIGSVLAVAAASAPPRHKGVLLLAATGLLAATTHDLAHFLVGESLGIRFIGLYFAPPVPVEPGLKPDYASYLRASPLKRALMHAAGAVVTKIVPFTMLGVARAERAPGWATNALGMMGATFLWIDLLLSTRHSDWKRFRRQIRLARR